MKYNIEKAYSHNGHIYLEGWLVGKRANDRTELMIYDKNGTFYSSHVLQLERLDVRNFYFPKEPSSSYGFMLRFTPSEESTYVVHLIAGKQMKQVSFSIREVIEQHALTHAHNSELKSLFGLRKTTATHKEIERRYNYLPKFSILVSIHQREAAHLADMFDSVLFQSYPNWELVIADCSDSHEIHKAIPLSTERGIHRIQYHKLPATTNPTQAQNYILAKASGEFCVLLECNDVLEVHALERAVQILNQDSSFDFIYSDYDLSDSFGVSRESSIFKPDWSPETLYSADYLPKLSIFRSATLRELGGWDESIQSIHYLKLLERSAHVTHIPEVLYHWRQQAVEHLHADYSHEGNLYQKQLQEHFARMHFDAVIHLEEKRQIFHVQWKKQPFSLSLLLIDINGKTDLDFSVQSWIQQLEREGISAEVAVLSDRHSRLERMKSSAKAIPINPKELARYVQDTAKKLNSDYLLIAYTQTAPSGEHVIEELAGWMQNPSLGVIVPRLLNNRNTILSEGVFLQPHAPMSLNRQFQRYGKSYFGTTMWYRNITAACPDCFFTKTALLAEASELSGIFWFQQYTLWVQREKHLRLLMTPFADVQSSYDWIHEINENYLDEYNQFFEANALPDNDRYFNINWIRQEI